MHIDNDLVKKLEVLSKLSLKDEEKEVLKHDLEKIVEMFGSIGSVDTSDVAPLTHMTDTINVMRQDKGVNQLTTVEALMNAPKRVGEFFAVPKVIE